MLLFLAAFAPSTTVDGIALGFLAFGLGDRYIVSGIGFAIVGIVVFIRVDFASRTIGADCRCGPMPT